MHRVRQTALGLLGQSVSHPIRGTSPSACHSPAVSSEHPAPAPARSAACAPSVLASHMQTAAGSGPAAVSPPSPRRLASLATEGDSETMQWTPLTAAAGPGDKLETPAAEQVCAPPARPAGAYGRYSRGQEAGGGRPSEHLWTL